MADSDHTNKTLTKEIKNLKLKQYIPFSVKLNASMTEHKLWSRWIFLYTVLKACLTQQGILWKHPLSSLVSGTPVGK